MRAWTRHERKKNREYLARRSLTYAKKKRGGKGGGRSGGRRSNLTGVEHEAQGRRGTSKVVTAEGLLSLVKRRRENNNGVVEERGKKAAFITLRET